MNSSTSGWSTSRRTIFAARRVLPPLLIVPEASAPRMKLYRAARFSPTSQCFIRASDPRKVDACARPTLKDPALCVPVQDRIHVVVHRQDEACRCLLRNISYADIEPNWAIESAVLMQQQPCQLRFKRVGLCDICEVTVFFTPSTDSCCNSLHDLPQRHFTFGGP